eukprot:Awhi_evm1s12397
MIKTTTLKEENDERRHQNRRNHEALLERYEARQNPPPPPPAASTGAVHSTPSKKHDWRKFFEDKLKALKKITLAKPDDFMTLLNTIATITDERDHDVKHFGRNIRHELLDLNEYLRVTMYLTSKEDFEKDNLSCRAVAARIGEH